MRALLPIIALLIFPACQKLEPKAVEEAKAARDAVRDKRIRQACASQGSYERLKALVFEQAAAARADPAQLDRLAASAVVRMEAPVVKSRDEALNVTVCAGRLVIELPPGAETAFGGDRRLSAQVEYAAQAAVDGSGYVYQIDGADPIVTRLAAFNQGATPRVAAGTPSPMPVATPEAPPAPQVAARPAAPPPPPEPRAEPERDRPRPALARPSFNCRYARTRTEQMVCADERLASRDRAMASLYYSAVANADPETRSLLRRTRDRFLAQRERCGRPACVAAAYEDRMDEIDRIMAGA